VWHVFVTLIALISVPPEIHPTRATVWVKGEDVVDGQGDLSDGSRTSLTPTCGGAVRPCGWSLSCALGETLRGGVGATAPCCNDA